MIQPQLGWACRTRPTHVSIFIPGASTDHWKCVKFPPASNIPPSSWSPKKAAITEVRHYRLLSSWYDFLPATGAEWPQNNCWTLCRFSLFTVDRLSVGIRTTWNVFNNPQTSEQQCLVWIRPSSWEPQSPSNSYIRRPSRGSALCRLRKFNLPGKLLLIFYPDPRADTEWTVWLVIHNGFWKLDRTERPGEDRWRTLVNHLI